MPVWWGDKWKRFGTIAMMFSSDLNFVGPLWVNMEDDSGGIFPIFYQKKDEEGYFFPLYNYESSENEFYFNLMFGLLGRFASDTESSHYRLFNGFYVSENKNTYQGFMPLYYYEQEDGQKLLVTPLGGLGWDAQTGENSLVNILGPLYIETQDKKRNRKFASFCWPLSFYSKKRDEINVGSFPLFWYNEDNRGGFLNILGLLYHRSYDKTENFYSALWPLSFYSKERGAMNVGSFPLFWYRKNRNDDFLNILGPVFHHYYDKDKSFYSVLWPLSFYSAKADETTFGSFPLFWYNRGKEDGLLNILGMLWDYRWDRCGWKAGSIFMLGGLEHKSYDDKYYGTRILPGKWRHKKRSRLLNCAARLKEEFIFRYLLFWEANTKKYTIWKTGESQKKLDRVSELLQIVVQRNYAVEYSRKRLKDSEAAIVDCQLKIDKKISVDYYRRRIKSHRKSIPLYRDLLQNGLRKQRESIEELTALLKALKIPVLNLLDDKELAKTEIMVREKYSTTANAKHVSVPFLYTYDGFRGDYKWDIFWFLANGKKQQDYEEFSILRYLYRYERSGEVSSRIIFPFISYKSAPDKAKFSFLWRVFDYKRENNKVSGHIFFIPF